MSQAERRISVSLSLTVSEWQYVINALYATYPYFSEWVNNLIGAISEAIDEKSQGQDTDRQADTSNPSIQGNKQMSDDINGTECVTDGEYIFMPDGTIYRIGGGIVDPEEYSRDREEDFLMNPGSYVPDDY